MPKQESKRELERKAAEPAPRMLVRHEVSEDGKSWRAYDRERDEPSDALFERFTLGPVLH